MQKKFCIGLIYQSISSHRFLLKSILENWHYNNKISCSKNSVSNNNEKCWNSICIKLKKRDYVFIEFRHNDEKQKIQHVIQTRIQAIVTI